DLFRGLQDRIVVYQDHHDEVTKLPDGFRLLASSAECAVQAIADPGRRWWGTQFHPEESPEGDRILRSFLGLARWPSAASRTPGSSTGPARRRARARPFSSRTAASCASAGPQLTARST